MLGFTNGIAVLIALSQLKDRLRLDIAKMPADLFSQVLAIATHLNSFNPYACALGTVCVLGLWVWPRPSQRALARTSGRSSSSRRARACLNLLVTWGFRRKNIWVTDLAGVVYEGRMALMDIEKVVFAQKIKLRMLAEVIPGADIFLGLSAGGVLKPPIRIRASWSSRSIRT